MGFSVDTADAIADLQSSNRGLNNTSRPPSDGWGDGKDILAHLSKVPGVGVIIDLAQGRQPDLTGGLPTIPGVPPIPGIPDVSQIPIVGALAGALLGQQNPYTQQPGNPSDNVVDEAKKALQEQTGSGSNKPGSDVTMYATVAVLGVALLLLLR